MSEGAARIATERQRQIDAEGYSPEHDLHHTSEELAWAAAVYAAPERIFCLNVREGIDSDGVQQGTMTWHEPWPHGWQQGTNGASDGVPGRIRDLERAGALIAAEIDRLLASYPRSAGGGA